MSGFDEAQERDMVLFIGSYLESQKSAMAKLVRLSGKNLIAIVLIDKNVLEPNVATKINKEDAKVMLVRCDVSSGLSIQKALLPYKRRLIAAVCRSESNIPFFKKVIPHIPYLNTPTESSLEWTTDKIRMRQLLSGYDKTISPRYVVAHDASSETLDKIEKKVGFPLIIKPAGLAASLLVTLCYHREELEPALAKTVRKIKSIYKKKNGRGEPRILVEEFMEGSMYSMDSYVNQRGVVYHTPLVHVRTGRAVGFEDFFGYMRLTPVKLKPQNIEPAKKIAEKAIEALNIRSTTCHIELMKTEDGWRVIELGPRIGGFRHEMYELSYGIDHSLNDILIRMPKKPVISKKVKGFTAVLQFYSKEKGRLVKIEGVNKIRKLESFKRVQFKKNVGDMCDFARNGDDPVFDIVLFNKDRSRLLADVRRLEQAIKIIVRKPNRTITP